MKKISISMLALSLIFIAGNLYACGNQSKADVNSSKADINGVSSGQTCPITGTSCETGANGKAMKSAGNAKILTTEYRRSSEAKNSDIKAASTNGACMVPEKSVTTSSAMAAIRNSSSYKDNIILMGIVDLSSFYQR
jgi:hypothetical protein